MLTYQVWSDDTSRYIGRITSSLVKAMGEADNMAKQMGSGIYAVARWESTLPSVPETIVYDTEKGLYNV